MNFGVVDLALHAASICPYCRQGVRPTDTSDREGGDVLEHPNVAGSRGANRCHAEQIWVLIRRLEEPKELCASDLRLT